MNQQARRQMVKSLFDSLDNDGGGELELNELEAALKRQPARDGRLPPRTMEIPITGQLLRCAAPTASFPPPRGLCLAPLSPASHPATLNPNGTREAARPASHPCPVPRRSGTESRSRSRCRTMPQAASQLLASPWQEAGILISHWLGARILAFHCPRARILAS